MAFDPTIPLQINIPTRAQRLSQAYAAQGAQQENQLRALQLQQAQQAVDQRNTLSDAYRNSYNPATGNFDASGFKGYLINHGQGQQAMDWEQRQAQVQLANQKAQQDMSKTRLANQFEIAKTVDRILQPVKDQRSYDSARQYAMATGIPEIMSEVRGWPALYDGTFVTAQHQTVLGAKDVAEQQLQQGNAAETARHNQATEGQTAANHAVEQRQRQQQLEIEGGRLNIEGQRFRQEQQYLPAAGAGQTGNAFLQTLDPNVASQVKAIAAGDVAMPNNRSNQGMALRNAVLNYDPTYTDARYKGKNAFKTGKDADTIRQSSAMLEHLERSLSNSDALGTSPSLATGSTLSGAAGAYRKDIDFYTGELGKLITNGSTTEGEAHRLLQGLQSPFAGIRRDALNEMTNLAKGNINAQAQKYKNSTGMDLKPEEWFDKATQRRLQRYQIFDNGAAAAPAAGGAKGGFNWNAIPGVK